jgi:mycothiol system anti-sigma-R factor
MIFQEIPCAEVLGSLIIYIDGDINLEPRGNEIQTHMTQCSNCQAELAHEQAMRILLQDVLRRTCSEIAPQDLHDQIHLQLQAQMIGQFASEVVTEFKMTEISIEIDEFGNIEHRETIIEHTQEIRFDDGQN